MTDPERVLLDRFDRRARFWWRVGVPDAAGCWPWRGSTSLTGYGRLSVRRRYEYAHRVSYELHVGPIAPGMVLDHLCRNRLCVNPRHLDPVTIGENVRRGFKSRRKVGA